jgi:hypothetical protein
MKLLVNQDAKRAVRSVYDDRVAKLPVLQAGSVETLSVALLNEIARPFDARLFTPESLSGVTFKAAIGIGYTAPVDGKLTLTFTDDADATETTAELDAANLTAASIEASLNALASVVTAGGVTVREADLGFFVVTFNTAGARELLTGDVGNVVPTSILDVSHVVTGDDETREIQALRIVQSAAALGTLSSASVSAGVAVAVVQTGQASPPLNHQVRIAFTGDLYKGSWLFSTSGGQSQAIGWDDSEAEITRALEAISGVGTGNVEVIQEDETHYLVTFIGARAATAITGIAVDGTNLSAIPMKSGSLDLGGPAVYLLLSGQTGRVVTLEVERIETDEDTTKVLRTDIFLQQPIIEPSMSMPTGNAAEVVESYSGSSPSVTVSSAGTTDLAPETPFFQWYQKVIAGAGSGAYTAKFTLDDANAVDGAIFRVSVELPASANPTVSIYNNTISDTLLDAVTNPTPGVAAYYIAEFRFDVETGDWEKIDGHFI